MLQGIGDQAFFYFVHSYYVVPDDPSCVWLHCEYGHSFCAAVRVGNMMATQFHPEKSQDNGLRLLNNFLSLTARPAGCAGAF
jgi:glutamine amidotransferase